jgi:hypothetical protein
MKAAGRARAGRLLVAAACVGLSLVLTGPALRGPLLSDDHVYLGIPALQELSARNLVEILDPWGMPALSTANYAPVHLLFLALERRTFGADPLGFHVVNALLHALNALLFHRLLRATPLLPPSAAALGAAIFLVHPVQMEAVAWMTQSKTLLAFGFATGGLLLARRHPAAASLAFGLGLLCKASASFALPVLAVRGWVEREGRRHWAWVAVWALLFLAHAGVQMSAFRYAGEFRSSLELDLPARVGQVVAIVGRYAVLSVSSFGASTYHQPLPPASLADPWLGLGCAALALAAWRVFASFRARSPEALFWTWAAAGFAPVSQILPFKFPLADRYLYFILPGLLGVAACWLAPWAGAWAAALRAGPSRAPGGALAAAAATLALLLGFAVHAHARAGVFRSGYAFMRDSQLHYPDGIQGSLLRAALAAGEGDAEGALDALETAYERGHRDVFILLRDPTFDRIEREPRFQALVGRGARWWIERLEARSDPTQLELRNLAESYLIVRDHDGALRALERALAHPDGRHQAELQELVRRVQVARRQAGS